MEERKDSRSGSPDTYLLESEYHLFEMGVLKFERTAFAFSSTLTSN